MSALEIIEQIKALRPWRAGGGFSVRGKSKDAGAPGPADRQAMGSLKRRPTMFFKTMGACSKGLQNRLLLPFSSRRASHGSAPPVS